MLFSIIHFGCWWEYFNLLERILKTTFHQYIKVGLMLEGYAIMLLFCDQAYQVNNYKLNQNFTFPVSIAGLIVLAVGILQSKQIRLNTMAKAALGLMYISLSWGLMLSLRQYGIAVLKNGSTIDFGIVIPICIVFSIWINDTMAYIVGSLIGKTPLSKISPKKTWEGTIGGIILSMIVIGLLAWSMKFSLIAAIVISGIASIVGTFGDLFESKLKRMAGVKDSGNFMPGHGGFLDRFDSLLLATPAVWLYVYFFMK